MKIMQLTVEEGTAVASTLLDTVALDGTYNFAAKAGSSERYILTPAEGTAGKFRVVIGRDPKQGRITLLLNDTEAVMLLGATSTPFGSNLNT